MKTDSAARGGAIIMLGRVIGMGCSFLLFLLLARHSDNDAGVFRTVLTFMIISEFLGLLGTQRWLAVEVAPTGERRWQLFVAACALGLLTAAGIGAVYLAVAHSGIYGDEIARGLKWAVLYTIPAALVLTIQTVQVGVGLSQRMGWLNLMESAVRSGLAIAALYMGHSVSVIMAIFVICRWVTALIGLVLVQRQLDGDGWLPRASVVNEMVAQIPRFALIMSAFLVMRNAAVIMLPALVNEREVALYAVPYQLYDLALLAPSILAISTNYLFARQALRGRGPLLWAVSQLWSVTSLFVLPLVTLALVFGADLLHTVFSHKYAASLPAFYLMMLSVPLMALDQVLSQTMQSAKRFREDAVSVCLGAVLILLGTWVFGARYGATGAAATLLATLLVVVMVRFVQLHDMVRPALLFAIVKRPLMQCMLLGAAAWSLREALFIAFPVFAAHLWLPCSALLAVAYLFLMRRFSGVRRGRMARIRKFLFVRHEARQAA